MQWQHGPSILSHQRWNPPMAVLWNLGRNCQNLVCCVWCPHWWSLASVLHRIHHQTVPCSSCRNFIPLSSGNQSLCSKFDQCPQGSHFVVTLQQLAFSPSPWSSGLLACHWCTANVREAPHKKKSSACVYLANQEKPPSVTCGYISPCKTIQRVGTKLLLSGFPQPAHILSGRRAGPCSLQDWKLDKGCHKTTDTTLQRGSIFVGWSNDVCTCSRKKTAFHMVLGKQVCEYWVVQHSMEKCFWAP